MLPGISQQACPPVVQMSAVGGLACADDRMPALALPPNPDKLHFEAIMQLLDRHGWHAGAGSDSLGDMIRISDDENS
ncbi:hypothetical protein HSX11_03850 [Oxalobacteraceae bacterium]|nr:hypothetical protein [Oxalobacteraceae bacterium]